MDLDILSLLHDKEKKVGDKIGDKATVVDILDKDQDTVDKDQDTVDKDQDTVDKDLDAFFSSIVVVVDIPVVRLYPRQSE